MSAEEDIELRDLVTQTLESNGCLAKIRAQLRASIFIALDEDVKISKQQPLLNKKVKTHLKTEEGKIMFCIVREFLDFFNLDITMSVFEAESYMGSDYQYEGRQKIFDDLGMDNLEDTTVPVLMHLIKIAQGKTKSLEINLNINSNNTQGNKSTSLDTEPTSNLKSDSNGTVLNQSHEINDEQSDAADVTSLQTARLGIGKTLNTTFDVSSPTISFNLTQRKEINGTDKSLALGEGSIISTVLDKKKESMHDDTYEETMSSIPEDVTVISSNNNSNISEECPDSSIQEISIDSKSLDKSKYSLKTDEKSKSKNSLNSLADLPPLQLNKSRVNDILPSLYSKEFKDKSNLRELDKMFDMYEDDYEEDFIGSSDLSSKSDLKSDHSRINLLDMQGSIKTSSSEQSSSLRKRDLKKKIPNRISDVKPPLKTLVNNHKGKNVEKRMASFNKDERGSISSISENIEISTSE